MGKQPYDNQLLKKVMLLFITLLIPLIGISFFALYRDNHNMVNKTLYSIHEENKSFINQLDDTFRDTYYNNFHLLEQSSVLKLSNPLLYMAVSEEQMRVSLLREQLSSFSILNPMIQDAHAYFLPTAVAYHSAGFSYGSYSDIDSDALYLEIEAILNSKHTLTYQKTPLHSQKGLSLVLCPAHLKTCDYGIQLCFSTKKIIEYLENHVFYENDDYLYSLDNGFMLTSMGDGVYKEISKLDLKALSESSSYQKVSLDNKRYYAFYYTLAFSSGYYIRLVSADSILNSTHPSYLLMGCFFVSLICAFFVFFFSLNRMLHRPLKKLTCAFQSLEKGDFSSRIDPADTSDFAYLFCAFNSMSGQLENLIEHDYNQKLLLKKAELKQLQAQINPHFLYNSFFMLQRMIQHDPEQAEEVANALAVYFQYITRNSMDHVPLSEEYRQAKSYAYIQGLRYTGRIQVDFDELPDYFGNILVPKLILQPILENAFHYGLENKVEDGILRVRFTEDNNAYIISVEDNGDELTDEKLSQLKEKLAEVQHNSVDYEITGILNIQRRLSVFLSSKAFLLASRSELGGLCLSLIFNK